MLGQEAWSPAERSQRFAEFVDLLDRLLRDPVTSSRGRFYSADEARTLPGCVQRPRIPFAVAAAGPRGMRVAATYGETWVTIGDLKRKGPVSAADGAIMIREQIVRLEEMCAQSGREPASLGRLVLTGPILDAGLESVEAFRDAVGRYAEIGVTDLVVHWPRADEPYAADLDTFERIFSA
jgi:alkanesulfonate monooxygenase SsuD/methylene tetrahydromethanopterin reductase-like flavin-dependent oxidoreductase (luciferase family)